ncbi:hypothetical protein [Pseudomonas syringae group genomosp. 3]|uniref:Uncharacterized protein n=1 Tax=Pseudomonas syringae group genomosp. 3 TaxID=251701 RepID=A0ABD6V7G6_9PSED|nr:hypothetical protein [Pseudomonas syringae group genomosp. 3]POD66498.1 hypothetical protein BKM07_19485 [Pseudomonas syringae group genomosp. 3]
MGTSITPHGALTYKEPDEESESVDTPQVESWVTIEADELTAGPCEPWIKPSYKEDPTEYSVVFTKNSPVGTFEWTVTYSMNFTEVTVEDWDLKAPEGVVFNDEIKFNSDPGDEDE